MTLDRQKPTEFDILYNTDSRTDSGYDTASACGRGHGSAVRIHAIFWDPHSSGVHAHIN